MLLTAKWVLPITSESTDDGAVLLSKVSRFKFSSNPKSAVKIKMISVSDISL